MKKVFIPILTSFRKKKQEKKSKTFFIGYHIFWGKSKSLKKNLVLDVCSLEVLVVIQVSIDKIMDFYICFICPRRVTAYVLLFLLPTTKMCLCLSNTKISLEFLDGIYWNFQKIFVSLKLINLESQSISRWPPQPTYFRKHKTHDRQ